MKKRMTCASHIIVVNSVLFLQQRLCFCIFQLHFHIPISSADISRNLSTCAFLSSNLRTVSGVNIENCLRGFSLGQSLLSIHLLNERRFADIRGQPYLRANSNKPRTILAEFYKETTWLSSSKDHLLLINCYYNRKPKLH